MAPERAFHGSFTTGFSNDSCLLDGCQTTANLQGVRRNLDFGKPFRRFATMTDLNSESFSDRQSSNQVQTGKSKRVQKNRPIVYNEMDRALRTFMALRRHSPHKMDPRVALFPEQAKSDSSNDTPADPLADLALVHTLISAFFGNDDHVNGHDTLKKILRHPALEPLEEAARFAATQYIFQAHLAYRRRTAGGYWVLPEIGAAHP